jgi:hypothetical protein
MKWKIEGILKEKHSVGIRGRDDWIPGYDSDALCDRI